jgi:NNP family nitrate/nitrite transporter-like MFS transporter
MKRWIDDWRPEDEAFWEATGRRVARRNLIWSILAENIGFSVWLLWSVTATRLPAAGFQYSTEQLFALVSLPGLIGALMRFPYTFAVPRFGGRNWTVVSALLLLIPTVSLSILGQRPATPFWLMALAACSAGLGGGNFASSMANISFFYPERKKGLALGLNAAGGNLGVSIVQLVVPVVIGAGLDIHRAGLMWLPAIAFATLGAFFFMDNLSTARSTARDQLAVASSKHTWVMSFLYIGTFGSFVGYSAAFPLLLKTQFPELTVNLVFLGPLLGSLARPLGGWLADRLEWASRSARGSEPQTGSDSLRSPIGGSRVTLWSFVVMGAATAGVIVCIDQHRVAGFLEMFLLLFLSSGVGNGSTFRMIPAIFRASRDNENDARRDAAAVIGISSAIGALGGFFIPRSLGASIKSTGGAAHAFSWFLAGYLLCVLVTWWFYRRRRMAISAQPLLEFLK